MKKIFKIKLIILVFIASLFSSVFFNSSFAQAQESEGEMLNGKVVKILSEGQVSFFDDLVDFQDLEIEIYRGSIKGESVEINNSAAGAGVNNSNYIEYSVGDKVKVFASQDMDGADIYSLDGMVKRDSLIMLTILFVIVVLAVGRKWGFLSLIGLSISFLIIMKLIIPMIINGYDPVFAAVLGSTIIIPTTFYVSHGFNNKTHVGVISTFIALIFTGFLASHFVRTTYLTGFASEEAGFLQVERQGTIDIRGILLAGIIIGTLGVLDDVTIGQASIVQQLKKANKNFGFSELFSKGMSVGQDHISSMINTLILVYAGSSLPLLLLFFDSNKGFIDIIEFELIAEEIVKMLVGSIGLILSAPLATVLAAYIFTKKDGFTEEDGLAVTKNTKKSKVKK